MDAHLFQSITVASDTLIFLFVGVYFWKLHRREKELEKQEKKVDAQYHQVIDNALTRERKILDDAVAQAESIIKNTQYISHSSKQTLDQTLEHMASELQNHALDTAKQFTQSYQSTLQHVSEQSLSSFQHASDGLEAGMQKQIQQFQSSLVPIMQKELDAYKQARMKEIDQQVNGVVQKVSQAVLNKSIPASDHQQLILEALEKSKQQGVFDEYQKTETGARSTEDGTQKTPIKSGKTEDRDQKTEIDPSRHIPSDQLKTDNQPLPPPHQTEEQAISDEIRSQSPGIVNAIDYGHPQPN